MKPYLLESIVATSAIALSGCGDNKNEIRKLDCYGVERINPTELTELNQSIEVGSQSKAQVVEICGAKYSVYEPIMNSGGPTTTHATIIITSDGVKYTLTKNIKDFLVEIPHKEEPSGALKYKTK